MCLGAVSVPNNNKCLVSVDTKLKRDAVGAFDKAVALFEVPEEVSQTKVPPFKTVAMRSSPKLSKDQFLPAKTTVDVDLGVFQVLRLQVPVLHPYP